MTAITPTHQSTLDVGLVSNYTLRCSCGYRCNIATTNPAFAAAEQTRHEAEGAAAFEELRSTCHDWMDGQPFRQTRRGRDDEGDFVRAFLHEQLTEDKIDPMTEDQLEDLVGELAGDFAWCGE